MFSFSSIFSCSLLALAATASNQPWASTRGCGEVNVVLTGLPPYHPLVASQGFNTTDVDVGLRSDYAKIVAAGYNIKFALLGPEKGINTLDQALRGRKYDLVGVGAGVRMSRLKELTVWFEQLLQLYRQREPRSPFYFNYNPTSTLEAIQRSIPLSSDCANSPGKGLGFDVFCDICSK